MRFSLRGLLLHLRFDILDLKHIDDLNDTKQREATLNSPIFVQLPGGVLVEVWASHEYNGEIILKLRGDRT